MMKQKKLAAVGLTVVGLLLAACGGGGDPLAQQSSAAPSASGGQGGPIVVGSANFTESAIIAEIYSQALAAKGIESSTKLNIGSREVYIKALQDSSISVVPEYTGNLLGFVDEILGSPRAPKPAVAFDFWQQFDAAAELEELRLYRPAIYKALPERQA